MSDLSIRVHHCVGFSSCVGSFFESNAQQHYGVTMFPRDQVPEAVCPAGTSACVRRNISSPPEQGSSPGLDR